MVRYDSFGFGSRRLGFSLGESRHFAMPYLKSLSRRLICVEAFRPWATW